MQLKTKRPKIKESVSLFQHRPKLKVTIWAQKWLHKIKVLFPVTFLIQTHWDIQGLYANPATNAHTGIKGWFKNLCLFSVVLLQPPSLNSQEKKEDETEELKSLWQFLDTKLFLEVTTKIMHKPTPSWKHFIPLNSNLNNVLIKACPKYSLGIV